MLGEITKRTCVFAFICVFFVAGGWGGKGGRGGVIRPAGDTK